MNADVGVVVDAALRRWRRECGISDHTPLAAENVSVRVRTRAAADAAPATVVVPVVARNIEVKDAVAQARVPDGCAIRSVSVDFDIVDDEDFFSARG
jgi:hypothetical protein